MGPRGDVVDKGQLPAQAVRLPVAQQNKPDKCGGRQRHPKTKPGSAACCRRLARCPSHCPRACCRHCGDMGILLAFSLYMTQIDAPNTITTQIPLKMKDLLFQPPSDSVTNCRNETQ